MQTDKVKDYEAHESMFSLHNVDELLEIQELLDQGINIAGIKKIFELKRLAESRTYRGKVVRNEDLRAIVQEELLSV